MKNTLLKILKGFETSSVDGQQVSARLNGFFITLASSGVLKFLVIFAPTLHSMGISVDQLTSTANIAFFTQGVGFIVFLFGFLRWIWISISDKITGVDSRVM